MMKYVKKKKQACPVSNLDVLEAISDQLSIDIITTISNHPTNPDNLMQMLRHNLEAVLH